MPLRTTAAAVLLFLVFAVYYSFLSLNLPSGAGPDEGAHLYAIDFIYQNNRLATYPEDVDRIHLTPYGTTRSFREPLAYVWGAAVSKVYTSLFQTGGATELSGDGMLLYSHRQGTALMGALGVLLMFCVVYMLAGHLGGALLAAAAFGLLPQYAFLASYTNNDIVASFVLLLLLLCVVGVLKHRTVLACVGLGVACGLVLLAKPTIWAPALLCVLPLALLLRQPRVARMLFLVAMPLTLAVGGWWYAFNAYHHDVTDVRNSEVRRQLESEFQTLPDSAIKSYGDLGYTAYDLLTNEEDFLVNTYKSSVGFLDWFKVSLGTFQYATYGLIWVLGGCFLLYSLFATNRVVKLEHWRLLALVFAAAIVVQFCIYLGWNLVKDRQPHGRYLLPALSFLFVSFGVLCSAVLSRLDTRIGGALATLAVLILLGMHAHAKLYYVIPYYQPQLLLTQPTRLMHVPVAHPDFFHETNHVRIRKTDDGILHVEATGPDPWIALDIGRAAGPGAFNYIEIDIDPTEYDWFKLYWDEGRGFHEARSSSHALPSVRSELGMNFPATADRLRLDLGEKGHNSFYLHSIALGTVNQIIP